MFEPPFLDRRDAGRKLAARLAGYRDERPVVLALPRGGAPVGYEVARSLGASLDVLVARKLGAPRQPELGLGAVAEGGTRILDRGMVRRLGVSNEYLERVARRETARVGEAVGRFRGGGPGLELAGRTAILVDDGLATGITARAAILAVRERRPRRVVLAAPVCAARTAAALRREVDDLVCLKTPNDLRAIGFWYENFEQVSDEEVAGLLKARHSTGE